MEYTKKILNKFFGLLRKDRNYYAFFKENLNERVISLSYMNLHSSRLIVSKFSGDVYVVDDKYNRLWRQIEDKILYPYWRNKVSEFLELLGIKENIEKYCWEVYRRRDIPSTIYYSSLGKTGKWESLMHLHFLMGHRDYHIIQALWYSEYEKRFYYKIKI